jgi:hypothetical protein
MSRRRVGRRGQSLRPLAARGGARHRSSKRTSGNRLVRATASEVVCPPGPVEEPRPYSLRRLHELDLLEAGYHRRTAASWLRLTTGSTSRCCRAHPLAGLTDSRAGRSLLRLTQRSRCPATGRATLRRPAPIPTSPSRALELSRMDVAPCPPLASKCVPSASMPPQGTRAGRRPVGEDVRPRCPGRTLPPISATPAGQAHSPQRARAPVGSAEPLCSACRSSLHGGQNDQIVEIRQ